MVGLFRTRGIIWCFLRLPGILNHLDQPAASNHLGNSGECIDVWVSKHPTKIIENHQIERIIYDLEFSRYKNWGEARPLCLCLAFLSLAVRVLVRADAKVIRPVLPLYPGSDGNFSPWLHIYFKQKEPLKTTGVNDAKDSKCADLEIALAAFGNHARCTKQMTDHFELKKKTRWPDGMTYPCIKVCGWCVRSYEDKTESLRALQWQNLCMVQSSK